METVGEHCLYEHAEYINYIKDSQLVRTCYNEPANFVGNIV